VKEMNEYRFRDLHEGLLMGTASDRYAGWIGQIYSPEKYEGKITKRSATIGGKHFQELVLPIESVREYFEHFSVLELDFTFYRPLLEKDGTPTSNYFVLQNYRKNLVPGNRLILKAPQIVSARRLRRQGKFVENPDYLNPEIFVNQFYDPALDMADAFIDGIIFEQEYQAKGDRAAQDEFANGWDKFLADIPDDSRYHLEIRTASLLNKPFFKVLESQGVGQVLSHWTWLPSLMKQFRLNEGKVLNSGGDCVIRLMTPLRVNYQESYRRAFPFDKMVEGMMSSRMIEETIEITRMVISHGDRVYLIINNRAGGNAPRIASEISERFLNEWAELLNSDV